MLEQNDAALLWAIMRDKDDKDQRIPSDKPREDERQEVLEEYAADRREFLENLRKRWN